MRPSRISRLTNPIRRWIAFAGVLAPLFVSVSLANRHWEEWLIGRGITTARLTEIATSNLHDQNPGLVTQSLSVEFSPLPHDAWTDPEFHRELVRLGTAARWPAPWAITLWLTNDQIRWLTRNFPAALEPWITPEPRRLEHWFEDGSRGWIKEFLIGYANRLDVDRAPRNATFDRLMHAYAGDVSRWLRSIEDQLVLGMMLPHLAVAVRERLLGQVNAIGPNSPFGSATILPIIDPAHHRARTGEFAGIGDSDRWALLQQGPPRFYQAHLRSLQDELQSGGQMRTGGLNPNHPWDHQYFEDFRTGRSILREASSARINLSNLSVASPLAGFLMDAVPIQQIDARATLRPGIGPWLVHRRHIAERGATWATDPGGSQQQVMDLLGGLLRPTVSERAIFGRRHQQFRGFALYSSPHAQMIVLPARPLPEYEQLLDRLARQHLVVNPLPLLVSRIELDQQSLSASAQLRDRPLSPMEHVQQSQAEVASIIRPGNEAGIDPHVARTVRRRAEARADLATTRGSTVRTQPVSTPAPSLPGDIAALKTRLRAELNGHFLNWVRRYQALAFLMGIHNPLVGLVALPTEIGWGGETLFADDLLQKIDPILHDPSLSDPQLRELVDFFVGLNAAISNYKSARIWIDSLDARVLSGQVAFLQEASTAVDEAFLGGAMLKRDGLGLVMPSGDSFTWMTIGQWSTLSPSFWLNQPTTGADLSRTRIRRTTPLNRRTRARLQARRQLERVGQAATSARPLLLGLAGVGVLSAATSAIAPLLQPLVSHDRDTTFGASPSLSGYAGPNGSLASRIEAGRIEQFVADGPALHPGTFMMLPSPEEDRDRWRRPSVTIEAQPTSSSAEPTGQNWARIVVPIRLGNDELNPIPRIEGMRLKSVGIRVPSGASAPPQLQVEQNPTSGNLRVRVIGWNRPTQNTPITLLYEPALNPTSVEAVVTPGNRADTVGLSTRQWQQLILLSREADFIPLAQELARRSSQPTLINLAEAVSTASYYSATFEPTTRGRLASLFASNPLVAFQVRQDEAGHVCGECRDHNLFLREVVYAARAVDPRGSIRNVRWQTGFVYLGQSSIRYHQFHVMLSIGLRGEAFPVLVDGTSATRIDGFQEGTGPLGAPVHAGVLRLLPEQGVQTPQTDTSFLEWFKILKRLSYLWWWRREIDWQTLRQFWNTLEQALPPAISERAQAETPALEPTESAEVAKQGGNRPELDSTTDASPLPELVAPQYAAPDTREIARVETWAARLRAIQSAHHAFIERDNWLVGTQDRSRPNRSRPWTARLLRLSHVIQGAGISSVTGRPLEGLDIETEFNTLRRDLTRLRARLTVDQSRTTRITTARDRRRLAPHPQALEFFEQTVTFRDAQWNLAAEALLTALAPAVPFVHGVSETRRHYPDWWHNELRPLLPIPPEPRSAAVTCALRKIADAKIQEDERMRRHRELDRQARGR